MVLQAIELSHIFKESYMVQRSGTNELSKAQLYFPACSYKLDKPFTARSHSSGSTNDRSIFKSLRTGLKFLQTGMRNCALHTSNGIDKLEDTSIGWQ
jgi:hypothetical protein